MHSRSSSILRDGKPEDIDDCRRNIGQDSDDKYKLSEFCRAPGTLKVFPAVQYSRSRDQKSEEVLFCEDCGDISPWIEDRLLGYEGEELGRKGMERVTGDLMSDGDGQEDGK